MAKRHALHPVKASSIQDAKLEVCRAIRRVAYRNGWTQEQLAQHAGTNPSRIGHAVKHQVDKVTLDQLFHYLAQISLSYRILIDVVG